MQVAQLRIYRSSGNTYGAGLTVGRVLYHDWTEALALPANPNGGSTPGWGAASNARFSTAGDVGTLGGMANPSTAGFLIATVTSDVQAFAAGTPNYGWSLATGNSVINLSENTDDGRRPVLFLSYTPVPEPMTLALLGLAAMALPRRRR